MRPKDTQLLLKIEACALNVHNISFVCKFDEKDMCIFYDHLLFPTRYTMGNDITLICHMKKTMQTILDVFSM